MDPEDDDGLSYLEGIQGGYPDTYEEELAQSLGDAPEAEGRGAEYDFADHIDDANIFHESEEEREARNRERQAQYEASAHWLDLAGEMPELNDISYRAALEGASAGEQVTADPADVARQRQAMAGLETAEGAFRDAYRDPTKGPLAAERSMRARTESGRLGGDMRAARGLGGTAGIRAGMGALGASSARGVDNSSALSALRAMQTANQFAGARAGAGLGMRQQSFNEASERGRLGDEREMRNALRQSEGNRSRADAVQYQYGAKKRVAEGMTGQYSANAAAAERDRAQSAQDRANAQAAAGTAVASFLKTDRDDDDDREREGRYV